MSTTQKPSENVPATAESLLATLRASQSNVISEVDALRSEVAKLKVALEDARSAIEAANDPSLDPMRLGY